MARKSSESKRRMPEPESESESSEEEEEESRSTTSSDDPHDDEGENRGLEAMEQMLDGSSEEEEESDDEEGGGEEIGLELHEDEEDEGPKSRNTHPVDRNDAAKNDATEEKCTLDLRNLLATNAFQTNYHDLFSEPTTTSSPPPPEEECETIRVSGIRNVNEEYLRKKATEGCTQLLEGLWTLETERTDVGPLTSLPSYFEYKTPRELPPPPPRTETKWEKFAKERNITPKQKRSRKLWDETTQSWTHLTGRDAPTSSSKNPESWPIMEVGGNDDPYEDPWQRARDERKERTEKNIGNRMRNEERVGNLERGTTSRVLKAKKAAREAGRKGGEKDMQDFRNIPSGVPLDLLRKEKRGRDMTKKALLATQVSTASLGKFDQMREGEPERKKTMSGMKKRKFESGTDKSVVKSEAKKSMKVLENVLAGGGKEKERAIRKGAFSKGETAYDYEYNDGLNGSSYKKKKGRAGMGKMRKITKKRMM